MFSNIQITVDGLSCAYYAGPPALSEIYEPITITCAASATGRYLKIERQVSGNLQFCEVRVFGKNFSFIANNVFITSVIHMYNNF